MVRLAADDGQELLALNEVYVGHASHQTARYRLGWDDVEERQASSGIMAEHVIGATAAELREARDVMLRMLKENGPPPTGRFEDMKYLEPVRDYKARHASTMLTFDAVVDAIGQIEKRRAGEAA